MTDTRPIDVYRTLLPIPPRPREALVGDCRRDTAQETLEALAARDLVPRDFAEEDEDRPRRTFFRAEEIPTVRVVSLSTEPPGAATVQVLLDVCGDSILTLRSTPPPTWSGIREMGEDAHGLPSMMRFEQGYIGTPVEVVVPASEAAALARNAWKVLTPEGLRPPRAVYEAAWPETVGEALDLGATGGIAHAELMLAEIRRLMGLPELAPRWDLSARLDEVPPADATRHWNGSLWWIRPHARGPTWDDVRAQGPDPRDMPHYDPQYGHFNFDIETNDLPANARRPYFDARAWSRARERAYARPMRFTEEEVDSAVRRWSELPEAGPLMRSQTLPAADVVRAFREEAENLGYGTSPLPVDASPIPVPATERRADDVRRWARSMSFGQVEARTIRRADPPAPPHFAMGSDGNLNVVVNTQPAPEVRFDSVGFPRIQRYQQAPEMLRQMWGREAADDLRAFHGVDFGVDYAGLEARVVAHAVAAADGEAMPAALAGLPPEAAEKVRRQVAEELARYRAKRLGRMLQAAQMMVRTGLGSAVAETDFTDHPLEEDLVARVGQILALGVYVHDFERAALGLMGVRTMWSEGKAP